MENVAVVGASTNEERYSNKAMKMLLEYGHNVIPIAPKEEVVLGRKVVASLSAVDQPVDTVTMYLSAARQAETVDALIKLKPRRVIFNPGAENPTQYPRLSKAGIEVVEACTMVLLRTNQF
ncbi:CoA-binding protein [Propionivibrio soli]|uniref:CoA-binding protein n=1 Tax=Propionivibrio soli TaxID=2976531 RepID=UPI0021E8AA7D|nr:CoA-binding protein [Propionivibrio soli]